MNYKGIYLLDTSGTPRTIIPPRNMLVWDDDMPEPYIRKVLAIVDSNSPDGRNVICETAEYFLVRYGHCAEIPQPRRATYRELSKWLAQGNGEMTTNDCYQSTLYYDSKDADKPCNDKIRVRQWTDDEWHEPTVDYMRIEEVD